jgi:hypothetical protein
MRFWKQSTPWEHSHYLGPIDLNDMSTEVNHGHDGFVIKFFGDAISTSSMSGTNLFRWISINDGFQSKSVQVQRLIGVIFPLFNVVVIAISLENYGPVGHSRWYSHIHPGKRQPFVHFLISLILIIWFTMSPVKIISTYFACYHVLHLLYHVLNLSFSVIFGHSDQLTASCAVMTQSCVVMTRLTTIFLWSGTIFKI